MTAVNQITVSLNHLMSMLLLRPASRSPVRHEEMKKKNSLTKASFDKVQPKTPQKNPRRPNKARASCFEVCAWQGSWDFPSLSLQIQYHFVKVI